MLIAGYLNLGAAAIRLACFTAYKQKGFRGIPTVLAAPAVSTICLADIYSLQNILVGL